MNSGLNENQRLLLDVYWIEQGGAKEHSNNFISEIGCFISNYPSLIESGNKKIESELNERYLQVEKDCERLARSLRRIDGLHRLNSLTEKNNVLGFPGEQVPPIDPLDWILTMKRRASETKVESGNSKKYVNQFNGLNRVLERQPIFRKYSKEQFLTVAKIIWGDIGIDSLRKGYDSWKNVMEYSMIFS